MMPFIRPILYRLGIAASAVVCIMTSALLAISMWRSLEVNYKGQVGTEIEHRRFFIDHGQIGFDNAPEVAIDQRLRTRLMDVKREMNATWSVLFIDPESDMTRTVARVAEVRAKQERYRAIVREKIELESAVGSSPITLRLFAIPSFVPSLFAGVFAVAPFISICRWRRTRHRLAQGLCLGCGYDIRASLCRCPECGRVSE